MKRWHFTSCGILVTLLVFQANLPCPAAEIVNGDFELGNVGFTTAYTYSPGILTEQTYTVDTDPANNHPLATSYGDHTSGSGNMLIANGSVLPDITVWQQSVSVDPHTQYLFSYYLSGWSTFNRDYPAQLETFVNDISIGSAFTPPNAGTWILITHAWESDTTLADIRIVDASVYYTGNDFAIDDIALTATIPAPAAIALCGIGAVIVNFLRRRRML